MTKQRFAPLLSVLLALVILLLLTGVVLLILKHYDVIDLSQKETPSENESVIPGDEGRFLEALTKGSAEGVTVTYDIASENLSALLKNNPPVTSYYIDNTFTYYGENAVKRGSNKIWRDGDRFRVQTYEEGELVKTVVCDGQMVYLSSSNGDSFSSYPASGHFEVESYASMPRPRDFFELSAVTDLSITLFRDSTDTLYHVSYLDASLGHIERLFLSVEYGLVLRAETYADQKLIYSLETAELHGDLSAFNTDVLFLW